MKSPYPSPDLPTSSLRMGAFTIIELVVSTAVLGIITLILLFIINQVTRTWQSEMARMDAYSNGRAIIDLMSLDLNKTVVEKYNPSTNNGITWGDVMPGTEFNWRAIYANFHTNLAAEIPSSAQTSVQPLFSSAIPISKSGNNTLRSITYALSNSFLIRFQSSDPNTVTNTVSQPGWGLTNTSSTVFAEILAENVYWVRVDTYSAGESVTNISSTVLGSVDTLPAAVRLTMRVAQGDLVKKIRQNPALADRLFMDANFLTNSTMLTNAGIREISTLIKINAL